MSSEPPTDGTNADEGFGAGSESDPFTDKMVSGDSEPLVRPITAALRTCLLCFVVITLSERFKNAFYYDSLLCKNSSVQTVCLPPNGKQKTLLAVFPFQNPPFFSKLRHFSLLLLSDQHDCSSLHCDVNAQCLLNAGTLACRCLGGFTGDGQVCVGECFISCRLSNLQHVAY